jgi:hypothetical protein
MSVQKQAISVAEMARQVGLSRARFYQLIGTAFPCPVYDVATRRPYYPADLQAVCLEVRHRNCGIDGKPVLFYARRTAIAPAAHKRVVKRPARTNNQCSDLLDGLRSLGLMDVTAAQVAGTMKELYPFGVRDLDEGEVLRNVFLAMKRRDTADNLTR